MGRLVKLTSGDSFLDRVQDQLLAVVNPALGKVDQVRATKLKTISLTLSDDWIAPTLLNSWVDFSAVYESAGYRKKNGNTEMRGFVKSGTNDIILALPAVYRPPKNLVVATTGAAFAELYVFSAGNVTNYPHGAYGSIRVTFEASDPSPVPNPVFPLTVPHELSTPPVGVFVADAIDTVSGAHVSTTVSWHVAGSNIVIDDLPGLFALRSYKVTFLIVG
jgi:hypothetical protein